MYLSVKSQWVLVSAAFFAELASFGDIAETRLQSTREKLANKLKRLKEIKEEISQRRKHLQNGRPSLNELRQRKHDFEKIIEKEDEQLDAESQKLSDLENLIISKTKENLNFEDERTKLIKSKHH